MIRRMFSWIKTNIFRYTIFLLCAVLYGCATVNVSSLENGYTVGHGKWSVQNGLDFSWSPQWGGEPPTLVTNGAVSDYGYSRENLSIWPNSSIKVSYGVTDHLDVGIKSYSSTGVPIWPVGGLEVFIKRDVFHRDKKYAVSFMPVLGISYRNRLPHDPLGMGLTPKDDQTFTIPYGGLYVVGSYQPVEAVILTGGVQGAVYRIIWTERVDENVTGNTASSSITRVELTSYGWGPSTGITFGTKFQTTLQLTLFSVYNSLQGNFAYSLLPAIGFTWHLNP